ncbi:hypothetical protein Ga0123462_0906 [Mariprofundus ferrinatatus]|uniref:Lipoprotein n=1 Tax=Mariprofundus ferrinatatus TaxID=1921087 RepID=A0A2K8L367_9PROT|nr:hypothetical protein [Mariprofundus ferrinatatus]ATX81775.1 hypothetical protein Ga0123462_0906 [Mariprofundus ferrinatatus]
MAIKQLLVIPAAMALMIAGCSSHVGPEPMQSDFGNSVKTNIARQTINPDAGAEQMAPATLDGQKAEKAMKTYREGDGKASTDRLVQDMAN